MIKIKKCSRVTLFHKSRLDNLWSRHKYETLKITAKALKEILPYADNRNQLKRKRSDLHCVTRAVLDPSFAFRSRSM